eukprot:maker-scaffold_34-snap-gene-2.38-mRNA-1 protein AED:0.07 eAED:0.07 QI:140/0.33/0.25/1/1/1/4/0/239
MSLVSFNPARLFSKDAKKIKVRYFCLNKLEVRIEQFWKEIIIDDEKGGTQIGFGACVYESSYILSSFLSNNRAIVSGKNVMEIGSGLGLVSIVCSKLGATRIIATDGDDLSVKYTKHNFKLNQVTSGTVSKLLWGVETFKTLSLETNIPKIDVLLASDVVAAPYSAYFPDLYNLLMFLFDLNQDMIFYLTHKKRGVVEENFLNCLKKKLIVEKIKTKQINKEFEGQGISLFLIKNKSNL